MCKKNTKKNIRAHQTQNSPNNIDVSINTTHTYNVLIHTHIYIILLT